MHNLMVIVINTYLFFFWVQSFDKGFARGKQKGLEGTQESYQNGFNAGHQAAKEEINNLNKDYKYKNIFNDLFNNKGGY